jgi:putative nucleotidyltransferase with HDIG domain
LALASITLPITLRPASFPLKVGDVASQDIQAPSTISYISAYLTEKAREDAESSVEPVYLPADPAINRHQIERLRLGLVYINTIRLDAFASQSQKISDLDKLSEFQIEPSTAQAILALNDQRWQSVQYESLDVLERVMRNTIREDSLDEVRRSIPTLVSFSLPEEQSTIVVDLVSSSVIPNSLFSPEQTEILRQNARNRVNPVTQSYISGETVLLRGQVIDEADHEALEQYGLVKPDSYGDEFTGAAVLIALMGVFIGLYMSRRVSYPMDDLRSLVVIAFLFLTFLVGARLSIPNRTVIPYLFPLPAFGLTIAVLFSSELAMVLSLIISILAAFGIPYNTDLNFFYILSSLCGILALGRARKVANFFWAAVAIGLAGAAVVLAYRIPDSVTDALGIATLVGASAFNGLASASLTLLFQFLFAQMLGLTTALQLMEITRPDHPLLQFLLRNAPGTYQHSLQVANLAEQAAEAVGADGLLTRVGALYHDVGKASNPLFFIENQVPGKLNPHHDLDPVTSAATIIQHVSNGIQLGKKHRLPPRILDFIVEHHGTLITRYQYTRAIEAAGGEGSLPDPRLFRYPGPRPRSRETALLMLADGCEARARADLPKDEVELRALIKRVFDYCQGEGQLDDTRLTLRDLYTAADSFLGTLKGIYHPRIVYPELKLLPNGEGETFEETALSQFNRPTTPISPKQTSQ